MSFFTLTQKPFELATLFRRQYSAILIFFSILVNKFIRFFQNSFENPGDIPTNRKKGIKIQKRIVHKLPVFKTVLHLKSFWCSRECRARLRWLKVVWLEREKNRRTADGF
jgi:hypothetical protein